MQLAFGAETLREQPADPEETIEPEPAGSTLVDHSENSQTEWSEQDASSLDESIVAAGTERGHAFRACVNGFVHGGNISRLRALGRFHQANLCIYLKPRRAASWEWTCWALSSPSLLIDGPPPWAINSASLLILVVGVCSGSRCPRRSPRVQNRTGGY